LIRPTRNPERTGNAFPRGKRTKFAPMVVGQGKERIKGLEGREGRRMGKEGQPGAEDGIAERKDGDR